MSHPSRVVPRGTPLGEQERAQLSALVARDGEAAVLLRIGLSRQALRSAMAGAPIYRVTASAIRFALAALDGAE